MAKPERAKHAFNSAVAFHEAALRCSNADPETGVATFISDLPGPLVVCMAFAAELYLKSLMMRRVDEAEGHNLGWLFGKGLDDDERKLVTAEFGKQEYHPEIHLPKIVGAFARTFVEWRYPYSEPSKNLDTGALAAFTRALYHAVRSLEPDWPVRDDWHARIVANNKDKMVLTFHLGEDLRIPPPVADLLFRAGVPHPNFTKLKGNYFGTTVMVAHFKQKPTTFKL